jgi:cyclohexanecarboxylate-CoA ligase
MLRHPDQRHPRAEHYRRPGGPWDGPALDAALATSLDDDASPGRALVVDGRERLDAAGLEHAIAHVAGGLRARGVRAGDVVAWQLPNGAAALLLYRACWRLGAVAAPVHHLASHTEVAAILARVEPRVVLADDSLPAAGLPGALSLEATGAAGLRAQLGGAPLPVGEVAVDPADVAVVLFTSGSTGRPKGVLHTHRGLAGKAATMAAAHGLTTDDAVLMPAPLAHVSGLLNGVLLAGVVPMPVVLMARWDPERALDLIRTEHVSFMIGPPTFFVGLIGAPGFDAAAVESLRMVSCGGAGVTPTFAADAAERLGAVVKRTYGSTEAPTMTTSTPADPVDVGWTTDGRPVGDVEVRIALPSGEIEVRGAELFAGYLDEGDDAEAFSADGERWFRTGDRGEVDADGRLVVTGRLRDVIIRGGENVAAGEVEAVLEAHPAVRQAVVVGQPDERLGERVAAFVVTSGPFDLEACRAWFAQQGVARFKTPERIEVVDAFPLLAAGKPDRRALEERLRR